MSSLPTRQVPTPAVITLLLFRFSETNQPQARSRSDEKRSHRNESNVRGAFLQPQIMG